MRLLITGSDTIPGQNILAGLQRAGLECTGIGQNQVLDGLTSLLAETAPDFIINAHQFADIEGCEKDPDLCFLHNEEVVHRIGEYAASRQIPLIQLSSCQVFDGSRNTPYKSTSHAAPLNQYGLSKWRAEQYIQKQIPHAVILRLGWLIGNEPGGVLSQLVQAKKIGQPAFFSDDHRGNPTAPDDVARVVVAMVRQILCDASVWGTYHYAGAEIVSQLAFARAVAEHFMDIRDLTALVQCASAVQVARLREPQNASLSCIKIRNTFGIKQRPWRNYLAEIVEHQVKPRIPSWGVATSTL